MSSSGHGEIIIETTRVGNALRVNAVDVKTGTEVTFQAPSYATQATVQRLAGQKLKYVMEKQK